MMDDSVRPIRLAQIGYGYCGPNLARNFHQLPGAEVTYLVDKNAAALERAHRLYGCRTTDAPEPVFADPTVDAVVIATPARTHFTLAQDALQAGKHVFVEKPLAMDIAEARTLVDLGAAQGRVLRVGHVFEYNPAVHYIKQAMASGELGEVFYLYSRRVNLGRVQSDVNALWSIAPHDISIALFLLDRLPEAVTCQGASCLNGVVEDVIFLTLHFPGNVLCHVHVSWLDPSKVREMTVVGSRKMIVYDDIEPSEKVKVYDKGLRLGESPDARYQMLVGYRTGDMWAPKLDETEALRVEAEHFVDCIAKGKPPRTDGRAGVRVVELVEAATSSMRGRGETVHLSTKAEQP